MSMEDRPAQLFGTDGIRGVANDSLLNPVMLPRIAACLAHALKCKKHRVVVGCDTRRSGAMITHALAAGFMGAGLEVLDVGILSTPAVAYLTPALDADFGVMISASHNPAEDNGIKIFAADGSKVTRECETLIEQLASYEAPLVYCPPANVGRITHHHEARAKYMQHVQAYFPNLSLKGRRLVVDCAHGALFNIAPEVLKALGATVITIGTTPTGDNINAGVGATAPQALQNTVLHHKADLGLAFDGDGDRLVLADGQGTLLDGDQVLALIAQAWQQKGLLTKQTVVGTVMTNRGLELFLKDLGIALIRADVGDRFVAEKMFSHDAVLGGEASGHTILKPYGMTGDGLVVALQVLSLLEESQKALAPLFIPSPQVHHNIRIKDKSILQHSDFQQFFSNLHQQWQDKCSLIVRASGTEPLIRVTLQGDDHGLMEKLAQQVIGKISALSIE